MNSPRILLRHFAVSLAILWLAGCALTGYNPQAYTVKSGDTLYFIAWKYQVDFKQLAQWNQLSSPYTIRPGDRIMIHPPKHIRQTGAPSSVSSSSALRSYTVKKGDTLYSIARKVPLPATQIARINKLKRPYTIYPGQRLSLNNRLSVVPQNTTVKKPIVPRQQPGSQVVGQAAPNRWLWPTKGKVLKGFKGSESVQQGIDISGRMGQTVHATAGGIVVYSGSGLVNYGQLVIVKHNETYLSAYGYNSKLLVKEGDKVKAGQAIANMGKIGQGEPLLHFEIRKHGKPINPLRHLPKKS